MAADFSNFDPNAGYTNSYRDFRPLHSNVCDCLECDKLRTRQAVERMKAATCKCGHVGAECFNDSYCEPVTIGRDNSYAIIRDLKADLLKALDNISMLEEYINDLQADYAGDIQAWHNVYQANEEVNDEVAQEQADRIIELESTVKVLAGMVN